MFTQKEAYNVAVVGATGAVGGAMLETLARRNFPVSELRPLASIRSAGKKIVYQGNKVEVQELTKGSFEDIDFALFSAGAARSLEFAPAAAASGAIVVDNSSAFRMDPDIPLVVPEVNPQAIERYAARGIIANPNCSTIQMVVALKPIYDAVGIKRIVVSTYQAVSGTGTSAIEELKTQTSAYVSGAELESKVYPHQIAFNCLPHIDSFLENGYTKEEMKLVKEPKKILGDDSFSVTATAVRIPTAGGHSEAVNIQFENDFNLSEVRAILNNTPGVVLHDDLDNNVYPMPIHAHNKDEVFVGRIRRDESQPKTLNMWIVADNLRKGAATNTIQIAEYLVANNLV